MKTFTSVFILLSLLVPTVTYAIHDDPEDSTKCLDCHFTLPFDRDKLLYTEDVGQVCTKCHQKFPCDPTNSQDGFSHPISVVPTMTIPIDMPLDKRGRVSCITCHSYHAEFWDAEYNNDSLLRRSKGGTLCYTCHKNFPKP